jgi:outer membrane protein assembly factor BamB
LESFHKVGSPASATPACDGERVYAFFGSFGLLCYQLDGTELWRYPMGPFQDEFGSGSSPLLVDGKVIVSQDHDIDSFVMAIDARTGKKIWRTSRPDAVRSYSSPALWVHEGHKEILVPGALQLTSYDVDTGSQRWWVNGLARIVIPLPVVSPETIYMASWSPGGDAGARLSLETWADALRKWDKNGNARLSQDEVTDPEVLTRFYRMDLDQNQQLDEAEWNRHASIFQRAQNAILAIRPDGQGDLTEKAIQWKYPRGAPYVSTPLLRNGILWMVKDGGIVTKLEAATGALVQQERLPGAGNYYASPVSADGKIYFASEQGVASVVADQRDWQVISSHDFKEKIYATPAVTDHRIIIRTESALYCFRAAE